MKVSNNPNKFFCLISLLQFQLLKAPIDDFSKLAKGKRQRQTLNQIQGTGSRLQFTMT